MLKFILPVAATILFSFHAFAEPADFSSFVKQAEEGKVEKAYNGLKETSDTKFTYDKLHLKYFALGKWAADLNRFEDARAHLLEALKFGQTNAAQIHYLIGHTYKMQKDYKKAADSFSRSLDFSPAQNIGYQTRFEFAEMDLLDGKLNRARDHLQYLERRWRSTPNYPDVIYKLMGAEFKGNRRHVACRWARKLFARYPAHPLVAAWGVELEKNKFEEQSIGCLASDKDVKDRIRYLSLSGRTEQARTEIDYLRAHARPSEKQDYDNMLVAYLENQGYPDEALNILLKDYETRKHQINYLNLLGKVASRAGEYQTAVGAFYSAHKLSPRSREGKNALFTAAFLSYQIQDYDGASRKFAEVMDKFPGTGLARDARWHVAWLEYLKGDYDGAEKSFSNLLNEKYYVGRRHKRLQRPFFDDRTKYWLAMSYVRQGKSDKAMPILTALSKDKGMSYYSLVAANRIVQLPGLMAARTVATAINNVGENPDGTPKEEAEIVSNSSPQLLFSPSGERESEAQAEEDSEAGVQSSLEGEAPEAAPEGDEAKEDGGPTLEAATEETEEGTSIDGGDNVRVTAFRDPRLRERFQRANNLMSLGMNEWAKWELFEIERRTSNKTYLKMLMEAYTKIGSYNRAAYISEVYFGGERTKLGLKDGRDLWTYNYPQAYEPAVEQYSDKFEVPRALVLSIMRAESQFNKDAMSPVGARGLMQVMPYTANRLMKLLGEGDVAENDLLVPEVNIRLGARYLSRLQKKFQAQIPLIAASYNAGPHRVYSWLNSFGSLDMDEFIEHVPFVETRNYMKKVVRNFAIYNQLYSSKSDTLPWLTQPVPMRVSERPSPRENWEIVD